MGFKTVLKCRITCATFALFLLTALAGYAQLPDFCATDLKVKESLKNDPERLRKFRTNQEKIRAIDKQNFNLNYQNEKQSSTVIIIPIVFHIIHENGPENVSNAQVFDAVRVLNNDFRKLNNDTTQILSVFKTIAADCEIEFRLAQIDPDGNCTNGIDRIYSYQTNIGDDGSKLNPWPSEKYYNVWVVKNISPGGIAGYAYYPGTAPPDADGVIILHNYLGSIGTSTASTSRVLTHETGHYLDLEHVWGSTNSPGVACGDDGVGDTPITKGWTSCNINGSVCTPGIKENVQNYMEYSYCTNMFSWGQKSRMIAALNSANGDRNSLWTPSNLNGTGVLNPAQLCTANFVAYPLSTTLCAGESITFKDISFNSHPTSWLWSFPGGTLISPSTLNDSMPVVQYTGVGVFDVSLSVSNSFSSANTLKQNYVLVNPAVATYNSNFYSESFESTTLPGVDWSVNDLDASGNTFQIKPNVAYSGLASAYLNNHNAIAGDVDELISPSINISAIPVPYFTFYYAYAPEFSSTSDQLIVSVSPDCGKTWYQRKSIVGGTLATSNATFSSFVPTVSQWKKSTVSITNMANSSNVRIKFKFISGGGNNLYIDDINIISALGINENQIENTQFSVYPNPMDDRCYLSFNLKESGLVKIEITDMLGQVVKSVTNDFYAAGNNQLIIEKDKSLKSGFYFLNFISKGKRSIEKISIR